MIKLYFWNRRFQAGLQVKTPKPNKRGKKYHTIRRGGSSESGTRWAGAVAKVLGAKSDWQDRQLFEVDAETAKKAIRAAKASYRRKASR